MTQREGGAPDEAVVGAALEAWAQAGRVSRVPVEGTSMAPLLRPGDLVEVAHGRAGLRLGDVVAVRAGERVVLHRLVRRRGRWVVTAGDARAAADAALPLEAVLGRVVAVQAGGARRRLDGRAGRALGLGLAAAAGLRRWPAAWGVAARIAGLAARAVRR